MKVELEGIESVIQALKKKRDSLPEKKREILLRLADVGENAASFYLSGAVYSGDPGEIFIYSRTEAEGKMAVYAEGPKVLFIEFGTGKEEFISSLHPKFYLVPPRGSYGKGKGANPPWYYYGPPGTNGKDVGNGFSKTYGDPANRFMYQASLEIRSKVREIVEEVFND